MAAVVAVVTAAGSGTRLGSPKPKALVEVGGEPMVVRAVRAMFADTRVAAVVVTAPATHLDDFRSLFAGDPRVHVVPGGADRQGSVALGLDALAAFTPTLGAELDAEAVVLVHDAARPLTPAEVVGRVIDLVQRGAKAVIPVLPVADTLVACDEPAGAAASTAPAEPGEPDAGGDPAREAPAEPVTYGLDRSKMRAVQTPQGFPWTVLRAAHTRASHTRAAHTRAGEASAPTATDDAALVAAGGEQVWACAGSPYSHKVTTAFDLAVLSALASELE